MRSVDIKKHHQERYGHYDFLVMFLGLTNARMTIRDLMNNVYQNYLDSFIIFFIDDIMVYSKSEDEHMGILRVVLEVLKEHQLFA